MAEAAKPEFWHDIQPVAQVFRPHALLAKAGDFVYEAPGEAHTLVAYEHEDPMRVQFNVTGPLVWLDDDGKPESYFDAYDYIELCKAHYEKVGIGAAYVDTLIR